MAGSYSTGVLREVREADQLKKKGVGSAHRKRMARQGWWLSGPISVRGGVPVLKHHLDGVAVLRRGGEVGWGAQAAKVWSGKERGDGAAMAALIAMCERERVEALGASTWGGKERGSGHG
jgi:hypothetical protein